ncbi:MAG: acyltransferase family protein [Myxococcales bacterium]|nr:acyltransferase family protein [Myxococcales bacterium]
MTDGTSAQFAHDEGGETPSAQPRARRVFDVVAGRAEPRRRRADPEITPVNADALKAATRGFAPLARYHRLDVRGLDAIPDGPALLVGNHNGGLNPVDGLWLIHYYRRFGYDRPIYILAHDILFKQPRIAEIIRSVGIIPAHPGNARRVLEAGHKLLVFPGGDIENLRPFRQRHKIVLAGRKGFARLSLRTGAPIVPIVNAGAHETLLVLSQGRRLAHRLGLHRWARIHSLPVLLAFPWGILAGPACALPYLPLPAKVTVQIGEPIAAEPVRAVDSPMSLVDHVYGRVEATMQGILDMLYAERSLPVIG